MLLPSRRRRSTSGAHDSSLTNENPNHPPPILSGTGTSLSSEKKLGGRIRSKPWGGEASRLPRAPLLVDINPHRLREPATTLYPKPRRTQSLKLQPWLPCLSSRGTAPCSSEDRRSLARIFATKTVRPLFGHPELTYSRPLTRP